MKIKILRNGQGPLCWYANHVGEVFDSPGHYFHLGMETGDYETFDPGAKMRAVIAREDCEVLPEPITADGKCPHCGEPVSASQSGTAKRKHPK